MTTVEEIAKTMAAVGKVPELPRWLVSPFRHHERCKDLLVKTGLGEIELKSSAWIPDGKAYFIDRKGRIIGIIEFEEDKSV